MSSRPLLVVVALSVVAAWSSSALAQQRGSILLLVDTSTSMKQKPPGLQTSKMAEVRRQLGEFCTRLPNNTRVSIFTFDEAPPIVGPDVVVGGEASRQALRAFFRGLETRGQVTHAWSSLEQVLGVAREKLEREPWLKVRVYAYTDGEDNELPKRDLDAILDQFDDILQNRDRIQVDYITLGFELGKDIAASFARHGIGIKSALTAADYQDLGPLEAEFSWAPPTSTVQEVMEFTDRSLGPVASYRWDFGDGVTSSEAEPVHGFEREGMHTVTLTVTSPTGRESTTSHAIEVVADVAELPEPPQAMFIATGTKGPAPLVVRFENQSRGRIEHYTWNFGDGSDPVIHTSLEEFEHEFPTGEYMVSLTAHGPKGVPPSRYTPDWRVVALAADRAWVRSLPWIVAIAFLVLLLVWLIHRDHKRERHFRAHVAKHGTGGKD